MSLLWRHDPCLRRRIRPLRSACPHAAPRSAPASAHRRCGMPLAPRRCRPRRASRSRTGALFSARSPARTRAAPLPAHSQASRTRAARPQR
eukprot:scaffold878_cov271-Pinguiococcus_pyrenoidosus.AAC.36